MQNGGGAAWELNGWGSIHLLISIWRHGPLAWGTACEFCQWPRAATSATSDKAEKLSLMVCVGAHAPIWLRS